MDRVTEILIEAKEILESEMDWCQFRMHDYAEGDDSADQPISACAVGAIVTAIKRKTLAPTASGEFLKTRLAVELAFKLQIPPCFNTIPAFNDDQSTTKEDVLLAFKKAIAYMEDT